MRHFVVASLAHAANLFDGRRVVLLAIIRTQAQLLGFDGQAEIEKAEPESGEHARSINEAGNEAWAGSRAAGREDPRRQPVALRMVSASRSDDRGGGDRRGDCALLRLAPERRTEYTYLTLHSKLTWRTGLCRSIGFAALREREGSTRDQPRHLNSGYAAWNCAEEAAGANVSRLGTTGRYFWLRSRPSLVTFSSSDRLVQA